MISGLILNLSGNDCQDNLFLSKIVRQYFEISGFLFSHSDQNYAAYLLLKGY